MIGSDSTEDPFEDETIEVDEDPFADVNPEDITEPEEPKDQGSFRSLVRKGESEFLPVLDPVILTPKMRSMEGRGTQKIGGKNVAWWEDGAMVTKHPYLLMNPTMMASKKFDKMENFRGTFGFPKGEVFAFMDSGGLQVSKYGNADLVFEEERHSFKENRIHPGRVVEWQAEYGDVGAIIDVGTFMTEEQKLSMNYQQWRTEIFEGAIEGTEEAVRIAHDYADDTDDDFELIGVLHGKPNPDTTDPFESYEAWVDATTKYGDYFGWAIGSTAGNIGMLALGMLVVNEMRNPNLLHGFGKATVDTAVLLEYIAAETNTFVLADSTKHATGSRYRQFMMPHIGANLTLSTREDGVEDDEVVDLDRMPCRCESCRWVEKEEGQEFITQGESSRKAMAIQLHNLNMILQERQAILGIWNNYQIDEIFEGLKIGGGGHDRYIEKTDIKFWEALEGLMSEKRTLELYYALQFSKVAIHDGLNQAVKEYVFSDGLGNTPELAVKPRDQKSATTGW